MNVYIDTFFIFFNNLFCDLVVYNTGKGCVIGILLYY